MRKQAEKKKDPKENLIPFDKMPKEKARAIQSAGGKALQAANRQRRTSAEITQQLLNANAVKLARTTLNDEDYEAYKALVDSGDLGGSVGDLIAYRMVVQAAVGDTKAATYTRDTAGDKPADNTNINANIVSDADRALIGKLVARETITATQINHFPEIRQGDPEEPKEQAKKRA